MRAITIIKSEHQNLGAVLYSLEQLVEEIEHGKNPDLSLFHGLLTYINQFLDRFHHPKEDQYLFPTVLKRAPDNAMLIRELERQHERGETLFVEMLKALSAYEFSGAEAWPAFRDSVHNYCKFERHHALMEESELLPQALEHLQEEDWQSIDAAFSENTDPMFGSSWDNEFASLFSDLVSRLPAPLGLGTVWKQRG